MVGARTLGSPTAAARPPIFDAPKTPPHPPHHLSLHPIHRGRPVDGAQRDVGRDAEREVALYDRHARLDHDRFARHQALLAHGFEQGFQTGAQGVALVPGEGGRSGEVGWGWCPASRRAPSSYSLLSSSSLTRKTRSPHSRARPTRPGRRCPGRSRAERGRSPGSQTGRCATQARARSRCARWRPRQRAR